MATDLLPSAELVTISWLKSFLPGGVVVGTTLPKNQNSWKNGFVQVSSIGGSPAIYTPIRKPVLQVDVWFNSDGGTNPPINRSSELAERIREESYNNSRTRMDTPILVGSYRPFRVLCAYLLTEPRRINDDAAGFARVTQNLQLHWVIFGAQE